MEIKTLWPVQKILLLMGLFLMNICALHAQFPQRLGYISIDTIHPGQNRYASKNVEQKIKEAIKNKYAIARDEGGYILTFDNGKSSLPETNALPVIKSPFGYYVLVDGHHDLISAITLGATTIPVKVIDDLSSKMGNVFETQVRKAEFWQRAAKKNYVYLKDLDGKDKIPPRYFKNADGTLALHDDPNRYFAAIVARKCDKRGQNVETTKGYDYPSWIKIEKDIPFIEFMIADRMNKHGIAYTYAMGDNPPREFVNQVRDMLRKDPIPGLRLIEEETYYTDINKAGGGLCNLP